MTRNEQLSVRPRRPYRHIAFFLLAFFWLAGFNCSPADAQIQAQDQSEVAPDVTPEIQQISPAQAAPGDEVAMVIKGRNFSPGVYVSLSDSTVYAVSTRRASSSQLEVKIVVSKKAQPGAVALYVSNPASTMAESLFTITAGSALPAPAPSTAAPLPIPPVPENHPAEAGAPEVAKVTPPSAGRGGGATVIITGRDFGPRARVSFSNPGIQVLETNVAKSTELTVTIQIASDAETGVASLFVVNPDDREAEAQFAVTTATPGKVAGTAGGTGSKVSKRPATSGSAGRSASPEQSFSVYSLANAISIFQSGGKSKGTLIISGKTLKYEEEGKEIFSTPLRDVQEIKENSFLGLNTGMFHIILKTRKTYNFIASTLRTADTQAILDSLRAAVK